MPTFYLSIGHDRDWAGFDCLPQLFTYTLTPAGWSYVF